MKRAVCIVALLALTSAAPAQGDAAMLEQAVQDTIRKTEASIACILVSRSPYYREHRSWPRNAEPWQLGKFPRLRDADGHQDHVDKKHDLSHPDYVPESFGSGIVIDKAGLILTCAHVVRGATKLFVRLPGGIESYADFVALDSRSDLAVLKLTELKQELKPVTFGDGDAVKKGQFVVALSNPYAAGFRDGEPSASAGIVSNLRRRAVKSGSEKERSRLQLHHFATLLQTDARLNLGCSGGALVNLKGEVIGILSAQAALVGWETPGGFALPTTAGLQRVIEVLRKGEEVEYGFLGVQLRDQDGRGVKVDHVIAQSPAQQAGIQPGDYLLSVGGIPMRSSDDIFLHVGMMLAGSTVTAERGRSPQGVGQRVSLTLAKYHVPQVSIVSKRPPAMAGLRVDHASLAVQRAPAIFQPIPPGVLIRDVEKDSPADKARLQPDKVITHVNRTPVTTPKQFYATMADLRGKVELTLYRPDGVPDHVTLDIK